MNILDSAELLLQAHNYSGSGNWLDESGNGHDASLFNSPPHTAGTVGNSYFTFTAASSHYMTIADHADLDFDASSDVTIMAMVYFADATPAALGEIVNKRLAGGAGWELYHNTDGTVAFATNDPTGTFDLTGALSDATLHTVGGRRDIGATDVEAFLDGIPTGSPTNDPSLGNLTNTVDISIGSRDGATLFLTGRVYAVALWRSLLTDAEVLSAHTLLTVGAYSGMLLLNVG